MPTGTVIYTFSTTDLDIGPIDLVTYSMAAITADADTYFELGSSSKYVFFKQSHTVPYIHMY